MDTYTKDYFEFLKTSLEETREFRICPYYDRECDSIFVYARDVQSYAQRLNPTITLFLATEDNTLVGFKLKGIQRMLKILEKIGGRIGCAVVDTKINLALLLEIALAADPDDPSLEDNYGQQLEEEAQGLEMDRAELVGSA